jgi:hypothetical protein
MIFWRIKVGNEVVRAPGEVTLTCYAPCRDITHTVTPDLKHPGAANVTFLMKYLFLDYALSLI